MAWRQLAEWGSIACIILCLVGVAILIVCIAGIAVYAFVKMWQENKLAAVMVTAFIVAVVTGTLGSWLEDKSKVWR